MARNQQPKVTGAPNNAPEDPNKQDIENKIFGGGDEKGAAQDPVTGVETPSEAPALAEKGVKPNAKQVVIDAVQFQNLMERLNELDNIVMSNSRGKDDVFNPLKEIRTDHEVALVYHGDDLVVGYKAKIRPDGREIVTYPKKDPVTGEVRNTCVLQLKTETGEIREEEVDHVRFIEDATPVIAKLKARKNVGKLVEHGEVGVKMWDGKKLVETGQRIMSGVQEEKYIFTVELHGEVFDVPENVVNIKR